MLSCSAVRAMPMAAVARVGSGSTRGRRGCGLVARAETSEMLPAPTRDTVRPKERRPTPLSISPQVEPRSTPAPSRPLPQFESEVQESGRQDCDMTVPAEGFTSSRVSPLPTTVLPHCPSPSSPLALRRTTASAG